MKLFKNTTPQLEERSFKMALSQAFTTSNIYINDSVIEKIPSISENINLISGTIAQMPVYLYTEDKSLRVLRKNNDYREFIIKGNQKYTSRDYRVEGDYSQGAFFLCANALGNDIEVKDLSLKSLQGDKEVVDILERMGVEFINSENGIRSKVKNEINSTIIDGSQCPDIIPVLAATAALAKGRTEIINASRLRIKECDRLAAVNSELSKLGVNVVENEDGLIIDGIDSLDGGIEVWSHKDHRIAMTLAIIATRCKNPIIIKDYECIAKSYPNFFEDYKMLGGKVDEWNVGK